MIIVSCIIFNNNNITFLINMLCMRYMNIASSSSSKMSLAAEFKRASPSKGDINVHVDIIEQVMMTDDDR